MLFSYIQQFVSSRTEAENLLVKIFTRLGPRLDAAFESSLSVYCWLQVEARKIILEYCRQDGGNAMVERSSPVGNKEYYFSLLQDAASEHRWVFMELFIRGRQREELAREVNRDQAYIEDLLRGCMQVIRKKLVISGVAG